MIKHLVSNTIDHPKFVSIYSEIDTLGSSRIILQLPAWRPGRYELGNFAKNIKGFEVKDAQHHLLNFKKITKDQWEVNCEGVSKIFVGYHYFAQQPDAGACYVNSDLIYLNPVHCFMYVQGRIDEPHALSFEVPTHWQIACQLPQENRVLMAPHFDALADSPVFVSPNLQHEEFLVDKTHLHFWFYGSEYPLLERLRKDTALYTKWQQDLFGDLPCKDYHFMYLLLPQMFRHGVEHMDSTVIAMGPIEALGEEDMYHDFLAISSHELFHLWNVKRIRPAEMLPYDFTRENYSRQGYVYEGVTTYYGDLALWLSGVWDWDRYRESLSGDITKHLTNEGRNHYSVADSSFDTWLDGYVMGVPGRKVSIYTEGLVAALIADVMIIEATNGERRLHHVMRMLYQRTWKEQKGYTKELYQQILEEVAGISFEKYFSDIIEGKGKMEAILFETLEKLGLAVEKQEDINGSTKWAIVKFLDPSPQQSQLFAFWSESH
jgi:predicted metalloprotease with PDZ domain